MFSKKRQKKAETSLRLRLCGHAPFAVSPYSDAAQTVGEGESQGGDFASSDGVVRIRFSKALTNLVKTFTSKVRTESRRSRVFADRVCALLCWCCVGRNVGNCGIGSGGRRLNDGMDGLVERWWASRGHWIDTKYTTRIDNRTRFPVSDSRIHLARCRPSPLNLLSLTARATCSVDLPRSSPSRLVNSRETAKRIDSQVPALYEHVGNRGLYQNPLA